MKKFVPGIIPIMLLSICLVGCSGTEVFEEKPKKPNAITEIENKVSDFDNPKEVPEELPEETEAVLGNGTAFVKVDDKVFFREYDKDAMEQTYLWGDMHGTVPDKGKRYIKCFNAATGNVETLFEDEGYGDLYYYNGLFYFNSGDGWYSVKEDGSDKKKLDFLGEKENFENLVGNLLFYSNNENEQTELMYYNLDNGERGDVCPVPEDEELGYPQITQIEVKGDDIFVGICYIAGTGNFPQGGNIYKCNISGESEPEMLKNMECYGGEEYIYIKDDGSYDYGEHKPGSAYVIDEDIWVCEKDGTTKVYSENFLKGREGIINDYAEELSYLDGNVYLIYNSMIHRKEDDIGWREAYEVFRSSNIRINESGVINEFNIVKGNPVSVPAFVYYVHELDGNGATQVIYQPMVLVYRDDRQKCENLGLDPDNSDLFMENFAYANPYYSEGFAGTISDNVKFKKIDYDDPSGFKSGGKNELIEKLLEDEYDMYTMLSLNDLQHDDYLDSYVFPEVDYTDPNVKLYNNIFADITFSEDGRKIVNVEEVYLP